MTVLTCKLCGGQVSVTREGCGLCQSCGTEVTLPKINEELRVEFYNRANYFRANGEFERAYGEFEHMIAQDPGDAEAYWSLVLCKFGITYEQDPQSGQYVPVAANVRPEPIWEDMDYQRTLQNSDEYAKSLYRAEAAKIDQIQDGYFSLVRGGKPYDVFLCFRSGGSSLAAETAQVIYENLTQKGVRVFREELLAGEENRFRKNALVAYALSTAKILFAITAGPHDLDSPAVRRQWTRFMGLMEQDRSRKIIPVYRNTEVYSIPEQIPTHEAICADQPGYWQDLTRGVLQILGQAEPQTQAGGQEFLEEARKAFEGRNFTAASIMAEQALNYEPNNAQAHYYALLSKHQAASFSELLQVQQDWAASVPLQRIIDLDDGELGRQASQFRTEYINQTNYQAARALMKQENYEAAIDRLEKLGGYRDAPAVLERCRKLDRHKKALHRYRAETNNDPYTHLQRKLQQDKPDVVKLLVQKMQRVVEAPRAAYPLGMMPLLLGVLAVIALFIVLAGNLEPLAGMGLPAGVLFALGMAVYGFGIRRSMKHGVALGLASLLYTFLVFEPPYEGLKDMVQVNALLTVFFLALIMFPLVDYLIESAKERKFAGYVADMNSYYANTVNPLEKQIVADIYERYGDVLTDREIGQFCNLKTLTAELMNWDIPEEEG